MKLRKGFVSNSSSSSFVCDFCGDSVSGYDMSLSEFDMSQCENGHIFCNGHATNSFSEAPRNEVYEYLLETFTSNLEHSKEYLNEYQEKLDGKREQSEWEKNNNWVEKMVKEYSEQIPYEERRIQELTDDFHTIEDDFDFYDKYSDVLNDLISDRGIPEKYCPVCQRQKKMQEDEKYEQYKELFDHFDGVKPNGCI